mgnify:FL=1
MKRVFISIVVPVYNSEKYLHRCINSILAQSYSNFELLLINDGSTDSSGIICDNYATKDSRVRVWHTANQGVSHARNIGIINALGDWISFIDSDDYVESNYIETFLNHNLESCDYALQDFSIYKDLTEKWFYIIPKGRYKLGDINIMDKIMLNGTPWGKLYKMSILNENKIMFDEKINIHEDHIFVLTYLQNVKYVDVSSNKGYVYCIDSLSSLSRRITPHDFEQLFYAYKKMACLTHRLTVKYNCDKYLVGFHSFLWKILLQCYLSSIYYNRDEAIIVLRTMKDNIGKYKPKNLKGFLVKLLIYSIPKFFLLKITHLVI